MVAAVGFSNEFVLCTINPSSRRLWTREVCARTGIAISMLAPATPQVVIGKEEVQLSLFYRVIERGRD